MDLEINCPHCNQLLQVSTQHSGQKMSCASCGGAFVVPQVARAGQAPGAPRREATGRSRPAPRRRERTEDQPYQPRRRSHSSSPLVPVLLTVIVLGVLGFVGHSFYQRSQEDTSLFAAEEDTGPKICTRAEMEQFVRFDSVGEKRYANYVANVYRADESARGKKIRLENEQAMTDMADHMLKNIVNNCDQVDLAMAQFIVDSILEEWQDATQRELEFDGVEQGGGFGAENAGESRVTSAAEADDGMSAILKEDRRLDRDARQEIRAMLEGVEVPEDYEARSRWLSIELAALRKEAAAGINLNRFAYRVTRCEELFIFFHQWASDEERTSRSFSWVEASLEELRNLRDRWRSWSSGQSDSLSKERVEEELSGFVRALERAETIFAAH